MKFIVSSTQLLKVLQTVGGVINSNNTMAILDNFLFELNHNELSISASDLETTMVAKMEVQGDSEAKIAVNARMLLDTLKTFPDQPLTFKAVMEEHQLEMSSDQGKYHIAFHDGDEFPKTEELAEATRTELPAGVLTNAINKTLFATGNDDLRPVMSGVLFQFGPEGFVFVGTDAHKLVKYARTDFTTADATEFIMPKKPLGLLKNTLTGIDQDVLVEYNNSNARFTYGNVTMICRLIDGKYPNYEAVIPRENPNKLIIDRTGMQSSTRRVSIFSNKTTHQVRLKFVGSELQVSAEDLDFANKAVERMTCDYNGTDMEIGFNSKFLLEMLSNIDSTDVSLEMSVPNRAGILKPVGGTEEGEEILMLVMPVMLSH